MTTELATAYLSLVPSLRGVPAAIRKGLGGSDVLGAADDAGKSIGGRIAGTAVKALGVVSAGVVALGGTVAGLAVKGGISRQLQIEDAQGKLRGLGHDTKSIETIMGSALAAVKGTAFGLGDAATVAASTVAAGIKPGQDLERVLKLVGDAATIAGTDMGSMGAIFNKVAATGKLQGDEILQLGEQGIPILQFLAAELGVTTSEAQKMASEGKVSFDVFAAAMEKGLGGAALSSGDTTRGAFANMKAALSRTGVWMTSWFFPLAKDGFNSITKVLDGLNTAMSPFAEELGTAFQAVAGPAIESFGDRAAAAMGKAAGAMQLIRTGEFTTEIGEALAVGENAPLVDTLLRVRDGASGIVDLLRGQFTPELAHAFNIGEDSPVISLFLRLRETASSAVGEVTGGLRAMWTALTEGGTEVTSTGIAGLLETVGVVARSLWDSLSPVFAQLGPQVLELASAFSPFGMVLKIIEPIVPQIADAAVKLAEALGSTLAAILPTVVDLVGSLVAALSGTLGEILPTLADVAVILAESLGGALAQVLPLVADLIGQLVTGLAPVLPAIASLIGDLATTFAGILSEALAAILPVAIELVTSVFEALQPILPQIVSLLGGVGQIFVTVMQALSPLLPALMTLVEAALGALLPILPTLIELFTVVVDVVLQLLDALLPVLPVIMDLASIVLNLVTMALEPLLQIFTFVAEVIADILIVALETIVPIITPIIDVVMTLVGALMEWLTPAFQWLAEKGTAAWQLLRSAISTVWDFVSSYVFTPMKTAIGVLGDVFGIVRDKIVGAWNTMKAGLQAGWTWIDQNVFSLFRTGIQAIQDAFSNAGSAIGTIWDGIKQAAATPINFVLDTVYNNGIREWWNTIAGAVGLDSLKLDKAKLVQFADGGVTPGYTPGRDVHHYYSPTAGFLSLSGGEGIMRPEFVRLVGGLPGINLINAAARAGRLLMPGQALASGGVVDGIGPRRPGTGGFPPEWVKNIGRGIAGFGKSLWDAGAMAVEILKDPIGAVKKAISEIVENAGSGGNAAQFFDIVAGFPGKFAGGLAEKVKAMLGDKPRDGAADMPAAGGAPAGALGVARMTQIVQGLVPGARITSGLRPGAITAVGTPSMHGMGRAIDIVGPMMQIFMALRAAFPNSTELIHSPAGALQLYKGRPTVYGEPTRSMHFDHVHWGMARGGVVPTLYDGGGYIQPGRTVVENRTGRPEPVFTGGQFDALLSAKSGSGKIAENLTVVAADMDEALRKIERKQRRDRLMSGLVGRPF